MFIIVFPCLAVVGVIIFLIFGDQSDKNKRTIFYYWCIVDISMNVCCSIGYLVFIERIESETINNKDAFKKLTNQGVVNISSSY